MLTAIAALLALAPQASPTETRIDRTDGPSPMHGTLLQPAGPVRAAAVIIAGSGPTDRDGNSPIGGNGPYGIVASTYRLLAEGLAARDVTTVRYDKRGAGANVAAALPEDRLSFDDYVADARAWTLETVQLTGRPCVWLIGHSEGALVAEIAAENNPQVCGLVLLAGAGRPASEVLREQFALSPASTRSQVDAVIVALGNGTEPPAVDPALAAAFRPSVYPYLRSWLPIDPAAHLANYDRPVMVGQGTVDLQVRVADAEALAAANPQATVKLWSYVNHVLKAAPDFSVNMITYSRRDLPLADGVVADVADFILQN